MSRYGWWAALLGTGLGALCLGPGLAPGYILIQDMVFVPDPAFSPFTFGLAGGSPRAVPSDLVVTVLAQVLPADLVQKLVLLGVFALGCSGAALLVPGSALASRLVAGAFYVWNPYVAERLLMGQWALLLGYAGLPWVVLALARRRLPAVALLPAAVGGFAAMIVTAVAALPLALSGTAGLSGRAERWKRAGGVALLLVAFSLPWLVTALTRADGLTGDPVGVDAFAARADGPFGPVVSLLSLGGVWNAWAVPPGFDHPVTAAARLSLVLAGIAGFWLTLKDPKQLLKDQSQVLKDQSQLPKDQKQLLKDPEPREGAVRFGPGLAVAAGAGFLIACLGVTEPGRDLLKWLIGVWSGFAVLRDAQQYLAPLALLAAVGLGTLTARLTSRWAVALALVPLAVVPTLAWGASGALAAVPYPLSWVEAREVIGRDPVRGDVLVLPFESYRRFPWNGDRAVLDPAQRFFATPGREVVVNDSVRVGDLVVGTEDSRAKRVAAVLSDPRRLAEEGIRYVVVDSGNADLPGARLLVDRPELRLYVLESARP
ncbi:hypothetical protein [Nonomuraea endophytica]|uniref:hypothetical protein n=1 Tax=Nonomuraea endophytica TaxID=714136 RepID=UPI0037C7E794